MIGADPLEVVQATSRDLMAFAATKIPAYVMKVHGDPIAIAGLYELGGELWGYLHTRGKLSHRQSIILTRRLLAGIKHLECDMPVIVICDEEGYPQAPKLLRLLGFEKTDRIVNNMEVWQWQNSHC